MSWKCALCLTPQPAGVPMNRYTTYRMAAVSKVVAGEVRVRHSRQIEGEIPCCVACLTQLARGVPMALLKKRVDTRSPCPESPPPRPAGSVKPKLRPVESDDGYVLFDGKWVKPIPLRQLQQQGKSN